jgi:hypothetical protein
MLHRLAAALALALPAAALGQVAVESVGGDVLANGVPVVDGQRLVPEASIVTPPAGQIVLRFGDGMQVAVGEKSRFRVVDFRYAKGPGDRAVLDLLQGSARVSTGDGARRNPGQFFLRTPQAQFGVQGPADFAVALVNPAYLTVNVGSVTATNGAGTVAFGAGSTATVATNAALAAPIAASSLPPAASSAMGTLQTTGLAAPSGVAAGAAATGTGVAIGTPVLVGAGIAGAAAAASDSGSTTTHH